MNIFVLDRDPTKAAQMQCDKHVVKMVLETAQLVSTAITEVVGPQDTFYRPTHRNHPCSVWARYSYANFSWLLHHGWALAQEYNYRYKKDHKSARVIAEGVRFLGKFPDNPPIQFVQAMPDELKCDDPVGAYRKYYRFSKSNILCYTNRKPPEWIQDIATYKEKL